MACLCGIKECVLCEAILQSNISDKKVCLIQGMLSIQRYRTRELLFREGDPSTHLVILKNGMAKLSMLCADGSEQILRLAVPYQILGITDLNSPTYSYTATATEESVACRIRYKDMLDLLEQSPAASLRVIHVINEELKQSHVLVRALSRKTAIEKVASFILSLMPKTRAAPHQLPWPLTRQEIANVLGLTEETVSRVMAELGRAGIINAPRGSIRILDYPRLLEMTGNELRHPSALKACAELEHR